MGKSISNDQKISDNQILKKPFSIAMRKKWQKAVFSLKGSTISYRDDKEYERRKDIRIYCICSIAIKLAQI